MKRPVYCVNCGTVSAHPDRPKCAVCDHDGFGENEWYDELENVAPTPSSDL